MGVDPGSRLTGYGCIERVGNQLRHIAHGTLYLANTSGKATVPLEERLLLIYEGLSKVIREFQPQVMAVEKVFLAKNAVSALKLGHARGAAILTGRMHQLQIFEYSATEVKQAVVGHGQADKDQVAKMVQLLMGKRTFETSDASDGLAVAICHAQFSRIPKNLNPGSYASVLNQRKSKKLSLAEAVGLNLSNKRVTK